MRIPFFSSSGGKTENLPLVLQVYPSRAESARDLTGLETAMQSLALNAHSPLALEIAATATSRAFLLRATHPVALGHLSAQVQSRYPQARITEISNDPLQLAPLEECSALELLSGAASYLPMRVFHTQDLLHEGVDPLLGILAAFNQLPADARAIAQLALVPAPPTWSAASRRLIQHSQQRDRQSQREGQSTTAPGMGRIATLFVVVLVLIVISRFHAVLLPRWLSQAGMDLIHGKSPALSVGHAMLLLSIGIGLLVFLFGGTVLFTRLSARIAQPVIYDQRLIAEKVARPAYRACLRLFVITPGGTRPCLMGKAPTYWHVVLVWSYTFKTSVSRLLQHLDGKKINQMRKMRLVSAWTDIHREWQGAWHVWQEWRTAARIYRQESRARAQSRQAVLAMLTAAYGQYHTASGGYFSPKRLARKHVRRLLAPVHEHVLFRTRGWSSGLFRSPHYLSVADLAALWHLPQAQDLANLPYMQHDTSRTLLAPPVLTTGQGYRLGSSVHAGQRVPVFLPFVCLRQNLLAVASTGKGKSSLLLHLALAQFAARTRAHLRGGLMQIDFHGDLHRLTLANIPPALEDEVIQIDLAERSRLVGLNPLDVSHGTDRDKMVDNLITIIEAIWPNSYGPRTENILEYACKSLVEANLTLVAHDPVHGPDEQYTLLDVVPLVRDDSFRHAILEQVHDPYIHAWWDQYFEQHDTRQQNEYTSSVVTKFSKFASSHVARRILGQPRSTINLSEIVAQEKILLMSCASGEVGSDIAAFLGAILLGLFHVTLAEQARFQASERRQFLVLIDEFQALTGVNYQTMLAELRKYGGSFVLATQSLAYLDRLDRSLRATVLANIDHLFAFAMSADDAHLLRLDGVEPVDIVNLPSYTCYARLLLDGQRLPLFSLRLDDPTATPVQAEAATHIHQEQTDARTRISLRSHLRYARPVGEIDDLLLSIQAREALMMKPAKGKTKQLKPSDGVPAASSQKTGTSRGTHRRRGSGNGKGLVGDEIEANPQETPLIHDLFASPNHEEGELENEEENHA